MPTTRRLSPASPADRAAVEALLVWVGDVVCPATSMTAANQAVIEAKLAARGLGWMLPNPPPKDHRP